MQKHPEGDYHIFLYDHIYSRVVYAAYTLPTLPTDTSKVHNSFSYRKRERRNCHVLLVGRKTILVIATKGYSEI